MTGELCWPLLVPGLSVTVRWLWVCKPGAGSLRRRVRWSWARWLGMGSPWPPMTNGCWTGRKPPLSQQDPCPHGDEKHSEANLKGSQALGLSVRVRWLWACKPGACSRQRRVRWSWALVPGMCSPRPCPGSCQSGRDLLHEPDEPSRRCTLCCCQLWTWWMPGQICLCSGELPCQAEIRRASNVGLIADFFFWRLVFHAVCTSFEV